MLAEIVPPQAPGIDGATSLPLIARNESPRPRSRTMRALRPSSLRALRLLAIFASSGRPGELLTKLCYAFQHPLDVSELKNSLH